MSLDSIVNVTITSQNLHMSQAGFGTPLIIAEHGYWPERVKSFSELAELSATNVASESVLYRTSESLLSQTPRVPKFKIGLRHSGESIEEALRAILLDDKDGDFYGILLASDYREDIAKHRADIESLISALKDKRLLAGIDLTKKEFESFSEKNGGLISRRLFYIYKEAEKDFLAAAWMGKMLFEPPGSITWAFKELDFITKYKLNTDITEKLKTFHINRHINVSNKGVTLDGKVSSGEYIDIIHGIDWLHVRIQERIFRLLMINGKIPYTLKGIDLVRSELLAQLKEGVMRGLLAEEPGPTVGIPDLETIPKEYKEKRILPDVKFSARLSGAIHAVEIRGTVKD
jgi:hypothetical protein